ncbi:hypothetical protein L7F22_009818 [Adiantum nelumboides]|nr:hypothetical protein [Adiantum nelumboides]
MGEGISEFFTSTIGVKQGCPLSPTLFGLLIDELEHMVLEFMQQEGIEEVMIGNAVIMLLLYADDVVLLAHSLEDAQKLMITLENFCLHSGLIVNGSKTKVMLVKTLNKEKPCIVYIKKWFGRWDALHLLYDASRDPNVNEAFLQRQCITAWETLGGSRFIHYTTHVVPNYKVIFFSERGSRTHPYMLEPIPLSAIRTIASIWLSSHSLRCEIGHWDSGEEFH